MDAQIDLDGTTSDGRQVHRITLLGDLRAEVLTYGALLARLDVPDGHGGRTNVVLGLPDLAAYEARNPNFGVTVGRFANRIARGRFVLDGTEHRLSQNEGTTTLHGGAAGFSKRVWRIEAASATAVTLAYDSADGEQGFPGQLAARVAIALDGTTLRLDYTAETDRPTIVNLTNHSYFNLAGEGAGDVMAHTLQIQADAVLELDADSLPTGRILPVTGTPFDFRTPTPIGARIRDGHQQIVFGLGYDCCFVLDGAGLRDVARVHDPASGRTMTVRTDQPAIQLYTANKLTGALTGPTGRTYRAGDGLCLETQHFPDSPNHPDFPATTLRPGTVFRSTTEYAFHTA